MQGPWSYDDSMGGNTITVTDEESSRCASCGGDAHAQGCAPREG